MSEEEKLEKASMLYTDANLTPNEERMAGGQVSLFSLATVNGVIYEEIKRELRSPNKYKLYKQMLNDSDVDTPYNLVSDMVSAPRWFAKAPKDAPEVEHTRAKMFNYMIATTKREWSEYIVEACSYVPYGYWVGEKIYSTINTPHGSFNGIVDFLTISQDTVEKWHFDDKYGEYIGLRQNLNSINHQSTMFGTLKGYKDIPRAKYLHLRKSPTRNNPEGKSILDSLYVCWKYKCLLEEYLTIGAIKDLGGIPIFEVDVTVLNQAADDPTSDAAKLVSQLKKMGQGLHAGDLQFGIVPKAYDGNNNSLYNFKLAGVEGGGKQIDILPIIKHYSTKILMRFYADVLNLGNDGSGSFALSDNKMSLLEFANKQHLRVIQRQLNHDLVRQIYKRNKWDYDPTTCVYFEPEKINDGDLLVLAKAFQNIIAVGGMPVDQDTVNLCRDWFDLPPLDKLPDDFIPKNSTRVAEGLETGLPNGTGDSTSMGGDRSTDNIANGGT